jgi:hypothetical protein
VAWRIMVQVRWLAKRIILSLTDPKLRDGRRKCPFFHRSIEGISEGNLAWHVGAYMENFTRLGKVLPVLNPE